MEQTTANATPAATPSDSGSTATTTIGDARAALALADSSPATPASATPTTETPAPAATTQAAADQPGPESVSTDPQKGEPPKWRWQDILANAREASAKEAEERLRQEYAWANQIDPTERDGLLTVRAALNGDQRAVAMIRNNPQALQLLRGIVSEQQAAADTEPEPDFELPVKDANGNVIGMRPIYSAERQAERDAWLKRQLLSEVQKELKPLKDGHEAAQKERAFAQAWTSVGQMLTEFRADPDFKANEGEIKALIASDQRLQVIAESDPKAALEIAYSRVYRDKVLPEQRKKAEAEVLANLQRQAVAGTTNPASAGAATPRNTLGDARAALEYANSVAG